MGAGSGSDGRLRRFLHLERARPARAEGGARPHGGGKAETEAATDTGGRIAAVERPRSPRPGPQPSRTGAGLGRFGPDPEPALQLVDADGRRPFVRCRRCGADNTVFATACTHCEISLGTPEQHAFDEQFWAARQAEAEREAQVAREREELRLRAEAEEARERRARAEALAREVGDEERRRLDALGLGGGERRGPWQPLGLRLVRRLLPDERWHPVAMGVAAGLAAVLLAYGLHRGSALLAVAGAAALVALLVHAPEER